MLQKQILIVTTNFYIICHSLPVEYESANVLLWLTATSVEPNPLKGTCPRTTVAGTSISICPGSSALTYRVEPTKYYSEFLIHSLHSKNLL